MSMLAHSPQLQFVTGLPDSPKNEAKGVVLVKGPWHVILSSPRLPFDMNQSLTPRSILVFMWLIFVWSVFSIDMSLFFR